jgi:hypothetical protein
MPDSLLVVVEPGGVIRFLWDDRLAALAGEGVAEVSRASHVEPDGAGGWTADLAPSDGPVLGPFPLRSDALDAERFWLEDRL